MRENQDELKAHIRDLEQRLAESNETLRALRDGAVDALEGAVTLTSDGLILFANQQFADSVAAPLDRVIGSRIYDFTAPDCLELAQALIRRAGQDHAKGEIRLRKADGQVFPAYLAVNRLQLDGLDGFCMMVTDLTGHRRDEESVASEQLARSILEQAAEAILVMDLDGRIIRASRAADRLLGLPVMLRKLDEILQIHSPGGLPLSFRSMLAMARRGAGAEPLEMSAHTPGGTDLWILFSVAPLSGSSGDLVGCIVHMTDVTHRKRIEKTVRESEEMYRNLADAMPHIVYIMRPDGVLAFVNRQWREFSGDLPGQEEAHLAWSSRLHPDDQARTLRRWSQAVKFGSPFEIEHRLRRYDGEYRWHLSRALPAPDDTGAVLKWIGTSTDIEDSKRTEARLRESETRLRTLTEAVPGVLFTALPDGHCDYISARIYELTGLPPGAMEGFGWLTAIRAEDRGRVQQQWRQCAESGTPLLVEYQQRRADCKYAWIQVRAEPMYGPDGNVIKWFGICSDIDDNKRLQEELARSNEELQRFAYAASHDLQEPLRTVAVMSSLLARKCTGLLDGESEELFAHIDHGVKRMTALIRDLLDYSRVSIEGSASLKPTDCDALLAFALMNLQAQIVATGATVTSDPLPLVMADGQLVRVFQNLLGNALKYRGENTPHIHFSAARNNQEWILAVRDNGIGFDMKYAERIFGVFQRLHGRTEYEGTGIGLAICKRIVERYGGRIWAESSEGAGATFFVSLPAAAAPLLLAQKPESASAVN